MRLHREKIPLCNLIPLRGEEMKISTSGQKFQTFVLITHALGKQVVLSVFVCLNCPVSIMTKIVRMNGDRKASCIQM